MTLNEVKTNITKAISDKYNMSVKQFADSRHPEKAGVSGGSSLRCYLSSGTSASTSFTTYKKLYAYLGLGVLEKEQEVIRNVVYVVKGASVKPAPRKPPVPPSRRLPPKKAVVS